MQKTFSDFLEIHSGYYSPPNYDPDKQNTEIKFLRITDIQNYQVNWNSVPFCPEITPAKFKVHQLKTDDIVIARTGATIGKTHLCINPPPAVPASYLFRLRIKKKSMILPRFFARYLQSPLFKSQLYPLIHGSCQPNIRIRDVSSLTIEIPTIDEQEKILGTLGTTLDSIDKLVRCTQEKLTVYQNLKQAFLREAFSVRSTS